MLSKPKHREAEADRRAQRGTAGCGRGRLAVRKRARNKCRKIHNERNKCSRSHNFFSTFFSPSSLAALPLLRTTPPHRRPARPLFNKFNYLPFDGSGNPSNVHEICGVGLPAAEHFKLTAGPGCSVCSMKLYSSTGGASVGGDI